MPLFYWTVDTSQFILQPQTTRWRSRYRGPRESWKQNLEMNQIAYDIHQLYTRTYADEIQYETNHHSIEFGLSNNLAFTITGVRQFDDGIFDSTLGYDAATPNTYPASINGSEDMVRRIQELQFRVGMLERNGWNISAQ
jgi:hypothetical protein